MTASDHAPAHPPLQPPPEEFLDRLPLGLVCPVFAVFALPQIVVAVLLAVAAPWFLSHHGVLINGEPHLYAPLQETLPPWALWITAALAFVLMACSWTVAVRFLALVHDGRNRPLRTALREAATTSPATMAAFALPSGLYLILDQQVHPGWTVALWSLLFITLPPLWFPLAGVALGPGSWREVLQILRRHPLRRGWVVCLIPLPLTFAVVVFGFHQVSGPAGAVLVWTLAMIGLTVSARALTLASLYHRQAHRFEQGEDSPPVEDDLTGSGHRWAPVALSGVLLVGLWVPAPLFDLVLTDGPWEIPAYDRWSSPMDEDQGEPSLFLVPDRSSVVLGSEPALCDLPEGCAIPGAGRADSLAMATEDGLRSVRFPYPDDAPPGSVIWEEAGCGGKDRCRDDHVFLVPEGEVDGEWGAYEDVPGRDRTTLDWQSRSRVWLEEGGGRAHVVSAVPSVGLGETMLTLFVCQDTDCGEYTSTELTRAAGAPWIGFARPRTAHDGLVDVAVAPNGDARVTVHDPGSGALTLYSCAGVDCADVTETVLVPASDVTRAWDLNHRSHAGAEVRVRPDGTPAIAYRATLDGAVHFLDCADEHCERFESVEVFGPGWNRPAPALDLDPQGLPRLLGHDLTSRTVEYVSCADTSCAETESVTVGSYPMSPGWVSLRVDEGGRPVMAWLRVGEEEDPHTAELVRCGDTACSMLTPAGRS